MACMWRLGKGRGDELRGRPQGCGASHPLALMPWGTQHTQYPLSLGWSCAIWEAGGFCLLGLCCLSHTQSHTIWVKVRLCFLLCWGLGAVHWLRGGHLHLGTGFFPLCWGYCPPCLHGLEMPSCMVPAPVHVNRPGSLEWVV